jgi:UDP-2,3-diacylglucosamine pyrophosphatase LpxH
MLVIISDLHLNDESASPDNVPAQHFARWWAEVLELVVAKEARKLEVLYLGDIFDLLRTEYWFYPAPDQPLPLDAPTPEAETFPISDRPWGDPKINDAPDALTLACRARAAEIAAAIVAKCQDQLAILGGKYDEMSAEFERDAGNEALLSRIRATEKQLSDKNIPIERLYLPGNHDRLFRLVPAVRSTILTALGAKDIGHAYLSRDHGVIARHGHEWDPWNFEAYRKKQEVGALAPDLFKLTPIGDVITTELVARLPFALFHELSPAVASGALSAAQRLEVYERLCNIEDVRPLHAALLWLVYFGHRIGAKFGGGIADAIYAAIDRIVPHTMANFMELSFVHAWVDKRDRWNIGFDEADLLQDLDRFLRVVRVSKVAGVLEIADWLDKLGITGLDHCAKGAGKERLLTPARDAEGIRYCVYGHTHSFKHEPLSCTDGGEERAYLNSGTWRTRVYRARDRESFARVKELTYLVFYAADEVPTGTDAGGQGILRTSYETRNDLASRPSLEYL